MLKRYSRMKDCAGLPKMEMSTPDEFFNEVRISGKNLCTWVGELFLELHNGTYTSLAKVKIGFCFLNIYVYKLLSIWCLQ